MSGQTKAREHLLLLTHLRLRPRQWAARLMVEKVGKHCFRLVNGFPGNIFILRKPTGKNYSSGKMGLETNRKGQSRQDPWILHRMLDRIEPRASVGL